ncbi:DPH3 protein, partial [Oxyruncus cristatus]|nr:DPH3 protein [Oxyruncus cristatus]
MSAFQDEVEIADFAYEEESGTYSCPCPCGVRILITRARGGREDLECGEDVTTCRSCAMMLPV